MARKRVSFQIAWLSVCMAVVCDVSATTCKWGVDVYFPARSALTSDEEMSKALQAIRRVKTGDVMAVYVVGHADPSQEGDPERLAAARSAAVLAYLSSQAPELAGTFKVDSVGATQPVAPASHANLNRRVEVEVVCVVPSAASSTANPRPE